jgi:hypothetical protein
MVAMIMLRTLHKDIARYNQVNEVFYMTSHIFMNPADTLVIFTITWSQKSYVQYLLVHFQHQDLIFFPPFNTFTNIVDIHSSIIREKKIHVIHKKKGATKFNFV